MTVSFKLNNADFCPLPPFLPPRLFHPSLLNINITQFAIGTNTSISSVTRILQDNFSPKLILDISHLDCHIPIKLNQQPTCQSVQSLQPAVVNLNIVSVPVCHRLHVAKSVFLHHHVSFLNKPMFLTVDTITDTLNVCNVEEYVSVTHNVRKVFPSTQNSISIPTQIYCPENNNNIANSHLPLTNLPLSSKTKFSTSFLTSNLNFSKYTFSLPEILCSRIYHHVPSSVKFSLFFIFLNAMLLHQPLQNVLIFNILTDFTLFLLVSLKRAVSLYKTCGAMPFYIKQHENPLRFLFDSFLTCNVLKITRSIPMEDFILNF